MYDVKGERPYRDFIPGVKEFYWMGWRAYADDLARHGWHFAQNMVETPGQYGRTCHIAIVHPSLGCEGHTYFSMDSILREREYRTYQKMYPPRLPLSLTMAKRMEFDKWFIQDPNWVLADAGLRNDRYDHPMRLEFERFVGLREIKVFRDLIERENQNPAEQRRIILEQASLSEVLEFALSKQEKVQEEIRRKRMTRSRLVSELHLAAA